MTVMRCDPIGKMGFLGKLGEADIAIEPVAVAQKKTYTLDNIATLTFYNADTEMSGSIDEAVYGV